MRRVEYEPWLVRKTGHILASVTAFYRQALDSWLKRPYLIAGIMVIALAGSGWLASRIPSEFAPREDRGAMFIIINGPQGGASYAFMQPYMNEIEHRLMPMVESGEIKRLLVRAPRGWGADRGLFQRFCHCGAGRLVTAARSLGDYWRHSSQIV